MNRLRQFWTRLTESLIQDHPAGIPQFSVCLDFEETDCTLRGCYVLGRCRLHEDPSAMMAALAKTLAAARSDHTDKAA